jgi:hypothetical protein
MLVIAGGIEHATFGLLVWCPGVDTLRENIANLYIEMFLI